MSFWGVEAKKSDPEKSPGAGQGETHKKLWWAGRIRTFDLQAIARRSAWLSYQPKLSGPPQ